MQTIESSLLQVSVDENGAQLAHLISKQDNEDYFASEEQQAKAVITFPNENPEKNLAVQLPWTVVDKGDARVSLTLIDNQDSYKKFPYHFEMMTTYALEGPQLNISFHIKNNSNKEMPFSLSLTLPHHGKVSEESISKLVLQNGKKTLSLESTDFKLEQNEKRISCKTDQINLAGETTQDFSLTLTIA